MSRDLGFYEVAPDVVENLLGAARHLEGMGAVIEEVALDWTVEVVTTTGPEQARLTCRAGRDNPLPHHEVRSVEALA